VPVLIRPTTRAVQAAFAALARLRAARAFHPRGALFAGSVEFDAPGSPTVAVLGAGLHPALVRVSKGAGTPGRSPDLLGLAVRLTDLPDGPVDLLHTTVGRHRCTGALLTPAAGWRTRAVQHAAAVPGRRRAGDTGAAAVPGGDVAGCGLSSRRTRGSLAPRLRGRQVRPSTVMT
jgi:hypothetical protein